MTAAEKIRFTVVEGGNSRKIEACENEYRNLMVLINDQVYPEGFGECGGQGRCATCMVRIEGGEASLLSERYRNEESTLGKKGISGINIRLSCQVLINSWLKDAVVHIEE